MNNEYFPLLLAENDENDIILLRYNLKAAGILNPLYTVRNGQEAIDYLSGAGQYADRNAFPLPELIFLDIKMPRKNGFEVLEWIRDDSPVALTPVVMYSSSQLQSEINKAYEMGVNAYFVKPLDYRQLILLFKSTTEYFASVARPNTNGV